MVDIAEEEEKINTTLSSEEAPLLAEVMKAIKGFYTFVPVYDCFLGAERISFGMHKDPKGS